MLKDFRHSESIKEEKYTQDFTITQLLAQKEQMFALASADCFLSHPAGDISPNSTYSSFPVLKSTGHLEKEEQEGSLLKSSTPKKSTSKGDSPKDTAHFSKLNDGKNGGAVSNVTFKINSNQAKPEREMPTNKYQSLAENNNSKQEIYENPDYIYKIIFVGNTNVGKTSFLQRVYEGSFNKDVSATVGKAQWVLYYLLHFL